MTNQALLYQRCKSILERSKESSDSTRLFHQFPQTVQDAIASKSRLGIEEMPIVCCSLDSDNWTLITSLQLISCRDGHLVALEWDKLSYASPVEVGDLAKNPQLKLQRNKLRLEMSDGLEHELALDPKTFHTFWKLIDVMMLTRGPQDSV